MPKVALQKTPRLKKIDGRLHFTSIVKIFSNRNEFFMDWERCKA